METCKHCNRWYIFDGSSHCKVCTKKLKLFEELKDVVSSDLDLDSMVDLAQSTILNYDIKMTNDEIVKVCNEYMSSRQQNQESLLDANVLYTEMDHMNNMVLKI